MKFDSTYKYYRILDNICIFIKPGIQFIVSMIIKKLETRSHKNTAKTLKIVLFCLFHTRLKPSFHRARTSSELGTQF